jgi:hypothetical protein
MPSSTLDALLERYQQVSAANQSVLRHFTTVAAALQRAQIPFVVLKGADVISRLYGLHGTRPLADVDLLFHETDLAAIDRLLSERGFAQQIDGNPSYRHPDSGLCLDMVTTLWYLDDRQLAEVWSRSVSRPFPPITMSGLSTEDLLIHLPAYAVVHRGQISPAFLQDLRLLVDREPPDWRVIIGRAHEYGLRMPLSHGLSSVRAAVPSVRITEEALSQLAPRRRGETLLLWCLRRLVTSDPLPELGHLLLFVTQRRGTKLAWLRRTLFPSSAFLFYRYGPAAAYRPGAVGLRRLWRLAVAGIVLSARLLRKLATAPARPQQC